MGARVLRQEWQRIVGDGRFAIGFTLYLTKADWERHIDENHRNIARDKTDDDIVLVASGDPEECDVDDVTYARLKTDGMIDRREKNV